MIRDHTEVSVSRLPADLRRRKASELVREILSRWERGEATDDDATIAAHPELCPDLTKELRHARLVRSAVVSARRVGPSREAPCPPLLSDSEIDAPIELADEVLCPRPQNGSSEGRDDRGEVEEPRPLIPGCLLQERVSVGGQAAVYRAVQESTKREVAVKVMGGGSGGDARQRARFEREADFLSTLRHPHIVNILDRGRTSCGQFYLVMEFVHGHDLDQWWAKELHDADRREVVVKLFAKLCHAVEEAHALGIVHRDLKPSNVRVDARGEPRVLDFGLARSLSNLSGDRAVTVEGQLLGSVPWASPEQAAAEVERVGPPSDVYSIGVMLYQAVAGRFPYPVDGPLHDVLSRIARAEVEPPSRAYTAAPDEQAEALDAVILKALAKDPGQRYATAGRLGAELGRVLAHEPVFAVRYASPPPRSRSLLRGSLVISAPIVLVIAVAVALLIHRDATRSPAPPAVFDLPSLTNSVGMRLVRVPPGEFWMGSMDRENGREPSERRRIEKVEPFFIGVCEVTQAQYLEVMGALPSDQPFRGAELPVYNVTWDDANAFCDRLGVREGRAYRLPTEVEWEYACRAGTRAAYSNENGLEFVGWYAGNSGGRVRTVAAKWPNAWGIHDMHGNVGEWCRDPFATDVQSVAGTAFIPRVVRGGTCTSDAGDCRSASRNARTPIVAAENVGFRVILAIADRIPSSTPE